MPLRCSSKITYPKGYVILLAERTGFEPAVPSLAHTLSKRAPSTTRPPLQVVFILADVN